MRINLKKSPPITTGKDFRNDLADNFTRIESAINTSDSELTNHQTIQLKAHKSRQITHNAWDVEQELQYRAAQVSNLVLGANGDGIEEVKDSRVAVFSKKAHATLSERLLEDFSALSSLYINEYSLNLANKQAVKFTDIGASVNGIIRGIAIDSRKDEIYIYQKEGNGAIISRHTLQGVMLDQMTITGNTGDNISLGLMFVNGYATLLFTVKRSDKYYVAFKRYVSNTTVSSDSLSIIDSLYSSDEKASVSVDEMNDELLFVYSNQAIVYKLSNALNNKLVVIRSFILAKDENGEPLKGFKIWDGYTYLISGTKSIEMTPLISVYDENGDKYYHFKLDDFKVDNRIGADSTYAWAMDVYHDTYTNKISLVFGVTYADDVFRKQQLYAIHQHGRESDHAQKMIAYSQNYAMTDGAGRMFNIINGTTSLKELNRPGSYYIRSSHAKSITDIPGDLNDGQHAYFLENSAFNDNGVLTQKIRVYTTASVSDVYERSFDTKANTVGQWQFTPILGLSTPKYMTLPTSKKLSDVITPGEQYISADVIANVVDLDDKYKGNGYLFHSSGAMPSNGRVQTMTRNSTNQALLTLKRIVSDNGITAWKEM
ncbi:phage baseplate protein [Brochothrix campestris]|uniref:P68 RBP/TagC-like beta-propeller domain-containing protein n=1 Tax=Brochothrix campestris FSL F6-1037 TaxID=1265861 RepID=W7CEP6_9LIST|nr:hypothetical protein [Brochothrix campestris]EUJ34281.1 hypothetical protein BCAMP_12446 [Brochothrix campestris FSL F6-1037]